MSDVVSKDITYYNKTYRLDEMTSVMGENVMLEIIEQDTQEKIGNIFIKESFKENQQMLKGKIVMLGDKAKLCGIKEGDIVLYDRWSCFFNPPFAVGLRVITTFGNILGLHKED